MFLLLHKHRAKKEIGAKKGFRSEKYRKCGWKTTVRAAKNEVLELGHSQPA